METNDPPKAKRLSFPKATGLLAIVFFAVVGYAFAYTAISRKLLKERSPVSSLTIRMYHGGSTGKDIVICPQVYSMLPIDSVKTTCLGEKIKFDFKDILFHCNPVFMVWMMLVCIMVSVGAGAFVFFGVKVRELYKKFQLTLWKFFFSCVFTFLIFWLLSYGYWNTQGYLPPSKIINTFHILLTDGSVVRVILFTMMILAVPGLMLLFLIGLSSDCVNIQAKAGAATEASRQSIEEAVSNLKYLNHLLQNTLQILAIIVVFSVLTTKTLGDAIKATISVKGFDLYPAHMSNIYGMYFSLFLCIAYIPVYAYLKNNYNIVNDLAAKDPEGTTSAWYRSLFEPNKFEGTVLSNLKLSLTVIAPFLTSFLPELSHLL